MISQKCPKCSSQRVRRGYRRTNFFMKLLFRYHLLCDNCNWEFTGFAVPGTVSSKPKRRSKKTKSSFSMSSENTNEVESDHKEVLSSNNQNKVKKKVNIKF